MMFGKRCLNIHGNNEYPGVCPYVMCQASPKAEMHSSPVKKYRMKCCHSTLGFIFTLYTCILIKVAAQGDKTKIANSLYISLFTGSYKV